MSLTVNEGKAPKKVAAGIPAASDVFDEIQRINLAHQKEVQKNLTETLNYYKQTGGQPGELSVHIEGGNVTVRIGEKVVHNFNMNPTISTAMYPDTEEATAGDMEGAELEANKPKAAKK